MDVRVAPDAATAGEVAAAFIARVLQAAIREHGHATVAFSGGRSPEGMLSDLAARGLPWPRVGVWQVDERVAPDGDSARNAALLAPLGAAGARLHLMPVTAANRAAARRRYATSLPTRFDVVHLGLGDDGHTASWPPGTDVAEQPGDVAWCPLYAGHERLTLTAATVNRARRRLVLVSGPSKAVPLEGWLLGDPALPVQHVRRGGTVLGVDAAAAARLPGVAG